MLYSEEEHPPPPKQDTSYVYNMSGNPPGPEPAVETHTRTGPRFNLHFTSPKMPIHTGYMNTSYLTTLAGYFKIAETVLAFIAFICAVSTCRSSQTTWTEYTAWTGSIVPLAFLCLYVIFPHISNEENTKQGLVFAEFIYYVIGVIFYFISFCLMANVASLKTEFDGISVYICQPHAAAIIACIFCLVLTVIFAVDAFFKFTALRRLATSPPPQNGTTRA